MQIKLIKMQWKEGKLGRIKELGTEMKGKSASFFIK